jgi:DNA-binding NtrC family response regulator
VSNVSESLMTSSGPPVAAASRQPPAPLRVLVVDGEPLFRWALATALEASGHCVVTVADGDAALHAVAYGGGLDAVLLDCQLADGRELRLLDVIRRVAPDLPVIGMTAFPSEDVTRRAREHGAIRILEKPFDVFSLDGVLLDVCTGQRGP